MLNIGLAVMGFYTSYEVEFSNSIEWDDDVVKRSLGSFNLTYLYLRDMELPRFILCLYSQHTLKEILEVMNVLYPVKMRYREYNHEHWAPFT
jgi:hypothetical protein